MAGATPAFHHCQPLRLAPLRIMCTTYEESVLYFADENGNLGLNEACKLLNDHDASLTDYVAETNDTGLNAESLLEWLGY